MNSQIGRVEPSVVLDEARKADLEAVVVIGRTRHGRECFWASEANGAEVLWLIERLKFILLRD